MLSPTQEQVLLDATALGLDDDLRAGYRQLLERIGAGEAPREAVAAILSGFRGTYAVLLANAFAAILDRALGAPAVLAMQVSGVSLSQRLYALSRETAAIVSGIVDRHVKGFADARRLTLALYEGYGFRADEPLKISPRNPKLPKYLRTELLTDPGLAGELRRHFARVQASKLKTPALRAAYVEAVDAMEQGAGKARLAKRLEVAFHERMRYFTNRIAQTELHRAYADRQAVELMDDTGTQFVQWRMSSTHPKTDICDYFARVDRFGVGPGVYPKARAPKAPAHPHCRCVLAPRLDIAPGTKAVEIPGAAQAWLREQGLNAGAEVMGSRARRDEVLKGADPVAVWNRNSDPLYRVGTVGEVPAESFAVQTMGRYPEQVPQSAAAVAARYPATLPNLNTSYQTANEGGRHSGMLKNYRDLPLPMIERGVRSIERQIEAHEGWITDPFSKLPATIGIEQVKHLTERKWPRDIARLREEADVLRGLIQERRNG